MHPSLKANHCCHYEQYLLEPVYIEDKRSQNVPVPDKSDIYLNNCAHHLVHHVLCHDLGWSETSLIAEDNRFHWSDHNSIAGLNQLGSERFDSGSNQKY